MPQHAGCEGDGTDRLGANVHDGQGRLFLKAEPTDASRRVAACTVLSPAQLSRPAASPHGVPASSLPTRLPGQQPPHAASRPAASPHGCTTHIVLREITCTLVGSCSPLWTLEIVSWWPIPLPIVLRYRICFRIHLCYPQVISTNFLKFSEIPKSVPKFLPKFDPNILREIFSAPSDLRGAMLSRAIQNVMAIIQCDWSAGAIVL